MTGSSLDARSRASVFDTLDSTRFDLLVIGGGVTGAGIARDAAMRGLSVALVEAADYASGTSSRSSKMIHGGLRYLAQGDVALVREAASERQILRRIAPHLARITPFIVPTNSLATATKLRAALWTFEKLGGVPEGERHEVLDTAAFARREPLMRMDGLNGAVVYPEFLTDDARLVLANVRAAQDAGAVVLNHAAATGLVIESGKATGAVVRSTLAGEDAGARVCARLIVNAAGPWVDAVRTLDPAEGGARLSLSRGIHLVLQRERLPVNATIILRAPDKRSIFAVPRGRFTYVGTTDVFHSQVGYWPEFMRADVDYLLDTLALRMKTERPADAEIIALWSGVRPLIAEPGKSASEVSRKDEVWTAPSGMISIAGGKLSAYRAMAARVVDLVVERLGISARPCATAEIPLPGGEAIHLPASEDNARLVGLYGNEAQAVLDAGGDVAAEAARAVLHEGAATLEDYWVRRSARVWFDDNAGLAALAPAAATMAPLLGWSDVRRAAEIAHCEELNRKSRTALRSGTGEG